jgi:hypothetical protein
LNKESIEKRLTRNTHQLIPSVWAHSVEKTRKMVRVIRPFCSSYGHYWIFNVSYNTIGKTETKNFRLKFFLIIDRIVFIIFWKFQLKRIRLFRNSTLTKTISFSQKRRKFPVSTFCHDTVWQAKTWKRRYKNYFKTLFIKNIFSSKTFTKINIQSKRIDEKQILDKLFFWT